MQKYTVAQFIREFATERSCVEYPARVRWPEGIVCPKCEDRTRHYLIEKRKCYECKECGDADVPDQGDRLLPEPDAAHGLVLRRLPDGEDADGREREGD